MSNIYQKIENVCKVATNKIAYKEFKNDKIIKVTYNEFEQDIQKNIKYLKDLNLPFQAKIGVNINRGYKVCSLIAACSYLNYIYVPIDIDYPDEYINYINEEINLDVLITQEKNSDLNFKIIEQNEKQNTSQNLSNECRFIYFTSGSTGNPKGVMHGEQQFLDRIDWMINTFPFEENEVMGQRAFLGTIPSEWDLFGAFFAERETIFIPDDIVRDINKFSEFIANNKITRVTLNPTLLNFSLTYQIDSSKLKTLKIAISLGEKLGSSLAQDFSTKYDVIILDDYGSTETNTITLKKYVNDTEPVHYIAPYLEPKVFDDELIITGNDLFLGYLGDYNKPSEYKTGDIVSKNADGTFDVSGRKDDIVKIHGKRVNSKFVEEKLKNEVNKGEVALTPIVKNNEIYLHAFLTSEFTQDDILNIRSNLLKELPDYMVPTQFSICDKISKLNNGKVNFKELQKMALDENSSEPNDSKKSIEDTLIAIFEDSINQHFNEKLLKTNFSNLGIDSVAIIRLVQKINNSINIEVSATDFYSYPTPSKFINHFDTTNSLPSVSYSLANNKNDDDVVIVSASGRFANYENLKSLMDGLIKGNTSFTEDTKLNLENFFSKDRTNTEKTYSKFGGFLTSWNIFDNEFFGLSTNEAQLLDPQQRFVLMETKNLLDSLNLDNATLSDQKTGVFIGADDADFRQCIIPEYRNSSDSVLGNITSLIANRISYYFDLTGPSVVINSACSSSLVAIIEATQSIKNKTSEFAIAGGVSIHMSPQYFIDTSRLNIFSEGSYQKTFSEESDGFLTGEGGGVILLTTEKKAKSLNLPIIAKIKSGIINQDGKSNGITAPNGLAQVSLIKQSLTKANLTENDIDVVECHGTGTKLGDLVELESLDKVFKNRKEKLYIGSIKSNIGHLNAAAGIASLLKSTLCINQKTIVTTPHSNPLNSLFDWKHSTLTVNQSNVNLTTLNRKGPIKYLINSFGIGGTNSSCIIEGYELNKSEFEFNNVKLSGHEMPNDLLNLDNKEQKVEIRSDKQTLEPTYTSKEKKILNIVSKQLNIPIETINKKKSIKDLNNSSLKIMNLKFSIQEEFNVDISLKDLLSDKTLEYTIKDILVKNSESGSDSNDTYIDSTVLAPTYSDSKVNLNKNIHSKTEHTKDIDFLSDEEIIELFNKEENYE